MTRKNRPLDRDTSSLGAAGDRETSRKRPLDRDTSSLGAAGDRETSRKRPRGLAGKVVLVTGAARGIGEHTARLAAARGARVALIGLEPDRLAALAAELNAAHPASAGAAQTQAAHAWAECDVTDQPSLDRAVAHVADALGGIDIVVANAGIASYGTVEVTPVEALARTIDVNLVGVVRTVAATMPHVARRRGYFLMVSSAAAFTALPGMAAYCASKAGVEQYANVLRLEVAYRGVGVGTAHPIWIDTDLVRDARRDLPTFGATLGKLPWPVGTVVSVGECARALVDGMARRRRRIYVPRSIGLVQALRTVVLSPFGDAVLRGGARTSVPLLEAEALALGRPFGEHSAGAPVASDSGRADRGGRS
ncbi:SDR family oxidoreductase [Rugosimonospora africana]|uniref:Oxidoreductase n=1 Tax=Rugosimonospora africana TaxID=556532 RepID=A0A8J3QT45_9ACTN|nr:SDR family oxidoreductase [Rugosimonospora africana]GIH16504.1 oxidoreductase [Rugosimonospora africana]